MATGDHYKKQKGVTGDFFQLGGPTGPALKNASGTIQVRSSSDSALASIEAAKATSDNHLATLKNLKDVGNVLIEFSFDGASAPSAGTNSAKYGICHTAGGAYSAGDLVYDSGSALDAVTVYKGMKIVTTSSVSGTISLNANGIYAAQTGTAPYSWTLKGDGSGTATGTAKWILLSVGTSATYDSTTSIASGARVTRVVADITQAYSAGATIAVKVNGSTPLSVMATSENAPTAVGLYEVEGFSNVGASNAGVVRVEVGGSPSTGTATVYVEYVEVFNS